MYSVTTILPIVFSFRACANYDFAGSARSSVSRSIVSMPMHDASTVKRAGYVFQEADDGSG